MSLSKFLTVKLVFGDDVRRIQIGNSSFKSLRESTLACFPQLQNESFTLKYLDEEKEWISVVNDNDVEEAVSFAGSQKALSKFTVFTNVEVLAAQLKPAVSQPTPSASVKSDSASSASSSGHDGSSAVPEVSKETRPLPTLAEITALLQDFFTGSYTRQHAILERELPIFFQSVLSDASIHATATVSSVLDAGFHASTAIRDHPTTQQLLQYINHEKVFPHLERILAHLKELAANQRLADFRERVVGSFASLYAFLPMLPFFLGGILSRISNQFQDAAYSGCNMFAFNPQDMFSGAGFQQMFPCFSQNFPCSASSQAPVSTPASTPASTPNTSAPQNPLPPSSPEPEVHHGITCDSCTVFPIRGERWRCGICVDYDLCSACHSVGVHPESHPLKRVFVSAPQRQEGFSFGHRGGWGRGGFGGWGRGGFGGWRGRGRFGGFAPQCENPVSASSQASPFSSQLGQLGQLGFDLESPASRAFLIRLLVENKGDMQKVLDCLL